MKRAFLISAICVLTSFASQSFGEIIVSIGNESTTAGGLVSVAVTATGDETLTGFDTPFDFGDDGFPNIAPVGLEFVSAVSGEPFGSATFFNAEENLQEDLIVNDLSIGGGVALDSTPLLLFTLNFEVGASVAAGTVFDLVIIRDDKFVVNGVTNPGSGTTPAVTVNNGSIVVAVPEPATASLLGLFALAGLSVRRRQK